MVTWSFLSFAVRRKRNSKSLYYLTTELDLNGKRLNIQTFCHSFACILGFYNISMPITRTTELALELDSIKLSFFKKGFHGWLSETANMKPTVNNMISESLC